MKKSNELKYLIFLISLLFSRNNANLRQNANVEHENDLFIYPVVMPLVMPSINEVYLCTTVDVSQGNTSFWIRGFEPRVDSGTVHHMILAGCNQNPRNERATKNIWNCGGQNADMVVDNSYPRGLVCNDKGSVEKTLFLWSRNGSKLMLPRGVGFKFGGGSQIRHLVLQVTFSYLFCIVTFTSLHYIIFGYT